LFHSSACEHCTLRFLLNLFLFSRVLINRSGANQLRKRTSKAVNGQEQEQMMDARWNWLIDNIPARVMLNTLAWCVWMAAAVGVLEFASKF
jgi:hypothetical protein